MLQVEKSFRPKSWTCTGKDINWMHVQQLNVESEF